MKPTPISGRARRRSTTRAVKIAEHVSRWLITIGGLGTIVAVAGIMIFLVSVVLPLFGDGEVDQGRALALPDIEEATPVATGLDEALVAGWTLLADGSAQLFRLDTGEVLHRVELFPGETPTAGDAGVSGGSVAFGFADGSVRTASVGVTTEFVPERELPASIRALGEGELARFGDGLVMRTPGDRFRRHVLHAEAGAAVRPGSEASVRLVSVVSSATGSLLAVLKDDDSLVLSRLRERRNLLTGRVTASTTDVLLPYAPRPGHGPPAYMLLSELGDDVSLAWPDGFLARYDTRDPQAPKLAEERNLLPGEQGRITALRYLQGTYTVMAGDDQGRVRAWFRVRFDEDAGSDGQRLTRAHELPPHTAAVTAIAVSQRDRRIAVAYADGVVRLFHVTSEEQLAGTVTADGNAARALALAPRNDGLLALTQGGATFWNVDVRHPETTVASLLLPVWYEGAPEPAHVWQSSGGTDDFEPKLGLWPLVFGTLKATIYSLFFSVPLALLAAIYTSEFLPKEARARFKQAIELMASLPSVVLGFLAALVLAPFVETAVPAVLLAFLAVPLALLVGAFLWQLLPQELAVRAAGWPRVLVIALTLPLGMLAAGAAAPVVERELFAGDIRAWLDGQVGTAFGGWLLIGVPIAALIVFIVQSRLVRPWLRRVGARWGRGTTAGVDLVRLLVGLVATAGVCWALALLLDGAGLDPRDGLVGTYVQRNALIVGFVMGFAVIPIIYTLAEDALSSVPDHLRAASLAAGATQWQTAMRVVVPTAMSGMFSAVMIGLGRAVGETMVVLMAAGNTPVLDLNVFNGFRTLSATIAYELPEAVRGGSLYRVLFLAALTLFAITFVINTVAELVRRRFRKRAYEL